MKRRGFIKRMALGLAALSLPLPKVRPAARINPAWVNAPYEVQFCVEEAIAPLPINQRFVTPILFRRPANDRSLQAVLRGKDGRILESHYPIRLDDKQRVVAPILGA